MSENATRKISRLTGHRLLAGAAWINGTNSGSRARLAVSYRWYTGTNIGGRFAADTGVSKTPGWICKPCSRVSGGKTHNGGAGRSVAASERHPARLYS